MLYRFFITIVVVAALLLPATMSFARAKTDIVVLVNGDHITGEIKSLYRGILSLSTDGMSTIGIEWDEISQIKSQYYFEIEDQDGYKYYGTPELTEDGEVRVTRRDAVVSLGKYQVVRITPIEKTFWNRISGSVNLGISYTKGSRIGRVDFSFNANYREEKNYIELRLTSNLTAEEERESIQRSEGILKYQRLFQRRLYSDLTGSSFRSDEQGIALRLSLSLGLGAHVVQTNSHVLESTLGLSINREWATDPTVSPTRNVEGVVSVGYSIFKYNTPKTNLASSATVLPRLPDFDRWRVDVSIELTQEIVSDFIIVLTFWDNFNNKPPSEDAAKNDWGITTSFGYSF